MKKSPKQLCIRGHDTYIVGRNKQGLCRACDKENSKQYREKNPEQAYAATRIWAKNNSYKAIKIVRDWQKQYPHKVKEGMWKQYGITNKDGSKFTQLDYDRLYQIQQGKCSICKRHSTEFTRNLSVDHDHKTGFVRGLLCVNCNRDLRIVENNGFVIKANLYLEESIIISNKYVDKVEE